MLLLTHPIGNQNVRAALRGFKDAGILSEFHTSIAAFPNDLMYRLGGLPALGEIRKRTFDKDLRALTRVDPFIETGRLLASKISWKALIQHEDGVFCIDAVSRRSSRYSARQLNRQKGDLLKAVYAYEDAALEVFQRAKQMGLLNLYDLPIGYWRAARQLMQEELDKRPEWASTLTSFKDSENKLKRKDEELNLADHVFVASSFTKKTLESYPGHLAPVHVIPYGFPEANLTREYTYIVGRPLKLLFVGGLSQRKGIANVLEAVEMLGDMVDLTIIGRKTSEDCRPLNEGLKKHRYIPSLAHGEILKAMREHDVLLFPSLFEGFGLVITEAMSQGTPVITTDRTAGADLIEDGKDGWLVEAGNTNALIQKIEEILLDPAVVERTGKAARLKALQRPWTVYGSELTVMVEALMKGNGTHINNDK
ncbi:glycosyltransferase family 4 protein [Olivibacter sitiensis]|uniref:glycosyltransferase family 4 protein n=1 Tax=Olivibacter sitiensis TaxID=376470 RepID=UPI00040383C0|nr:glycosyltransferase family 4 protein [Olivibacter sitiensis]